MTIQVGESDISRESLLGTPDFDEKTQQNIADADVLIVPKFVEYEGQDLRRFPAGTADFVKLAKQELSEYNVSLCENEGNENTFSQRFAEVLIPVLIIAEPIVLNALLNFVGNYVLYRLSMKSKSETSDEDISLELILEDGESKRVKRLSYRGNIDDLKDEVIPYAEKFFGKDEKYDTD